MFSGSRGLGSSRLRDNGGLSGDGFRRHRCRGSRESGRRGLGGLARDNSVPSLILRRSTGKIVPSVVLVLIEVVDAACNRHAVERTARSTKLSVVEAVRLAAIGGLHHALFGISTRFLFIVKHGKTYVAELVASLLSNRYTTPLLDELGNEVDTSRLALDATVDSLLLGLAGLVVVDADGTGGLRGRGGGDGELRGADGGDVDVDAEFVGHAGGRNGCGHVISHRRRGDRGGGR